MKAVMACALSLAVCVVGGACGDSGPDKNAGDDARDASSNNGGGNGGLNDAQADGGASAKCPSAPLASGEHMLTVTQAGQERRYMLHVPAGLGDEAAPLVINFHGRNSNAQQEIFLSDMNKTADAEGFIVAYPEGLLDGDVNGTGAKIQSWNAGKCCAVPDTDRDDVGFARAVVKDIESKLCVDKKRVYATGMSNGGFMTHKVACDAADLFAAAASVSGELVMAAADCNPSRPVPMMMFHGTSDMRVPYEGVGDLLGSRESFGIWRDKNGCTGEPEVTFSNGSVSCETYKACKAGVEVTLCTIEGMGHCWPGQTFCVPSPNVSTTDISANDAMWKMFERFTLP